MSHTVEVTQAASNAYFMTATGQHVDRANTGAASSVMLKDVAFAGGTMPAGMAAGDTALKFTVSNGTGSAEVTFTAEEVFTKNLTLNDLANRINNARYTDSSGKKTALDIRAGYDSVTASPSSTRRRAIRTRSISRWIRRRARRAIRRPF